MTLRGRLLFLFTVSGFAGLIYESIWSHYLGLLLGHAAWAQTLVLAIFMGGLAVGAFVAGRVSDRIRAPLVAYATVEAAAGALAFAFPAAFGVVRTLLHESWLPALGSGAAGQVLRSAAAAALILPQSLLLGATFPLMGAALLRMRPADPGKTLALAYFTNSLGGAVGVIACGFWLIPLAGLPGTTYVAGGLNLGLAAVVLVLAGPRPAEAPLGGLDREDAATPHRFLLFAAWGTGVASFFYEIAWIRMLSLVLGTTIQSFELMLSVFIAGLAFGGWAVRRNLDRLRDVLRTAGYVQILMAAAALATLPLYGLCFDAMSRLHEAVPKDETGWLLFHLGSHAIAAVVMFPAAFLAGMTLPLFTWSLLSRGAGESALGRVYAANTVGAIVGVLAAVHVIMPAVGTRGLVIAGAGLDAGLGLALLFARRHRLPRRELRVATAAIGLLLLASAVGVRWDPRRLASGVYRHGQASLAPSDEVVFHRDGKTATVALVRTGDGTVKLTTNGKADAAVGPPGRPAPDEVTQVLLGAIPLMLRPRSREVAVVGFGSGMTSHTVLASPAIVSVDSIEIEEEILRAARVFAPRVPRVWSDPRSHVRVDDAKSWLSAREERYDLIVSEPSNPWVTGVAGLFSVEFYRHAARNLADDGLLIQWLQLYETDLDLVASILSALDREFADWAVFHADNANVLIAASPTGAVGALDRTGWPMLAGDLAQVGIMDPDDLELRRLGGPDVLRPFLAAADAPPNTDDHPYVAHRAPKARFLERNALDLTRLHVAPVPVLEMLDDGVRGGLGRVTASAGFTPSTLYASSVPGGAVEASACAGLDEAALRRELLRAAPYLALRRSPRAPSPPCDGVLAPATSSRLHLLRATAARDAEEMVRLAALLLDTEADRLAPEEVEYFVAVGLAGSVAAHLGEEARRFATRLEVLFPEARSRPFYLELLLSHAAAI